MLTKRALADNLLGMSAPEDARYAPHPVIDLWPDPEKGPWAVRVWWRYQGDMPEPVGIALTTWSDEHELTQVLPSGGDVDAVLPTISSQFLRAFPVGEVLRNMRGIMAGAVLRRAQQLVEERGGAAERLSDEDVARLEILLETVLDFDAPSSGPAVAPNHYKEVARVYREALMSGAPTKAVAEHFKISKATAATQVARARKQGFLPETTRGRTTRAASPAQKPTTPAVAKGRKGKGGES